MAEKEWCSNCEHHKENRPDGCICEKTGRRVCEPDPGNKGGFRLIGLKKGQLRPDDCPGFEWSEGWKEIFGGVYRH